MIATLLTGIAGIVISLFLFWKRMKEDYPSETIFSAAFLIYALVLIGWGISARFFAGWFFWTSLIGMILGILLSVLKFRLRFYETFEAMLFSLLPWLSFIYLQDSVTNSSLISFIAFVVVLAFIFLFYYFDAHYKEFAWYKSGRIGFAGLSTAGIFFLVRAGIAIFFTSVLSFTGAFEVYISSAFAFISFLMVFNLSRITK